jgi:crotonobetainyl-CoA:carnitine CoA-transferase CaiB-like acyl-CoA transferase
MLSLSREKRADVLGASYILPASDGYVAVSPREEHQWTAWRAVMNEPDWADDPRFATHAQRLAGADELVPFMSRWTEQHAKSEIAALAQEAHIPCFAMNGPLDVLDEAQVNAREFLGPLAGVDGAQVPRGLFGLASGDYRGAPPAQPAFSPHKSDMTRHGDGPLPLSGIRVLDLSWVIAGPTTTRYLAAFGADVVKVEAPARADPGHRSELHAVLGRGKRDLAIDLKASGGLEAVRALAAQSDIVVENFATGALDRLGLGYEVLKELREDVILLSASGLGRTGPDAGAVAYGTLVQCFAGFADLNGYDGRPPTTGFAWSDPVLGLLLPFAATAALSARDRTGQGRHIDLAMSESLLWAMPGTLLEAQRDGTMPRRLGNTSRDFYPHDTYQAAGSDQWVAIAVTTDHQWRALCAAIDGLESASDLPLAERRERSADLDATISAWTGRRDARETAETLQAAGVPAAASLDGTMLFEDDHLWERGFYESVLGDDGEARAMVGLPWRWDGGTRQLERAPTLGGDNIEVLHDLVGLSEAEIDALRAAGALGGPDAEAAG